MKHTKPNTYGGSVVYILMPVRHFGININRVFLHQISFSINPKQKNSFHYNYAPNLLIIFCCINRNRLCCMIPANGKLFFCSVDGIGHISQFEIVIAVDIVSIKGNGFAIDIHSGRCGIGCSRCRRSLLQQELLSVSLPQGPSGLHSWCHWSR